MLVEVVDDGIIQVRYDDGTRAGIATVVAYDESGKELFNEIVNSEGIVYYDSTTLVHQIVADDGLGHRATWSIDSKDELILMPLWIRALFGVSILLFIASLFHYRKTMASK